MSLTVKVLLGVVLGICLGLVINLSGVNAKGSWVNIYLVDGLFLIIGKLFINALKMLVVPLVFFSLICGVCGIGNIDTLGRVGGKAFLLYLMTTAVAIAVAISISVAIGLGEGMTLLSEATFSAKATPPLSEVLINIVPSNPVQAMANGDMLPLIFFTILLGISMLMIGEKAAPFIRAADIANEIMMKMVMMVMAVAPYAVFVLISRSIAELGLDLLNQLAGYVLVLVGALLIHLFVTLMVVLKVFSGLNPLVFLHKMRGGTTFRF